MHWTNKFDRFGAISEAGGADHFPLSFDAYGTPASKSDSPILLLDQFGRTLSWQQTNSALGSASADLQSLLAMGHKQGMERRVAQTNVSTVCC
jgi:hypothetical protein